MDLLFIGNAMIWTGVSVSLICATIFVLRTMCHATIKAYKSRDYLLLILVFVFWCSVVGEVFIIFGRIQ